jgi:hypothetical protein
MRGAKYKGFSFQSEYTYRVLSQFSADGPLPVSSIRDQGFFAEAMHMVVPRTLGIYALGSYIFDDSSAIRGRPAVARASIPTGTGSGG